MAIAEYFDETSGPNIRQSRSETNGIFLCLEIKFHVLAFRVRGIFNTIAFTVKTKSIRLPKILTITALFLNFTVASCDLVETPHNKAVIVGSDSVKFKCKSDAGYRLKWLTHQNSSKQVLFDGYSISKEAESFCRVENGEFGRFYLNLSIKNEAAQTYICHEPDTNNEFSADLIIIEREAQCKTDPNTSHVIMTCYIEFRGNWAPKLEWSYNGTLITEGVNASIISHKSVEEVNASIVSNKSSVSSTLIIPLSANDCNYTCTTKFDIGGKPHWTTSDNIPEYVSNSVLTVKANQEIAKEKGPLSASGTSVGLVIGIIMAVIVAAAAFIVIIIYLRRRRRKDAQSWRKTRTMIMQMH